MSEGALPHGGTAEVPDKSYHPSDVPPPDRLPESVIDAAITWAVRLNYNAPTVQDRHAFERWLHADLLHGIAWQRVHSLKGFQSDLGALPPKLALDALQTAQAGREHRSLSRRNAMKLLSLAGIAVTAGWIVREQTPWQRLLADVSTGIGEQKTLHLDDGSVIVLNIDSAISTDLVGPRRLVVLRRGEILITTGADAGMPAKRPFWVYTPFGRMQALGTRFVVRLDKERARISVQQGAVELHPADGGVPAVVQAGESRWLMDDGTAPAELQGFEADGWAEGVIAGKNILLQDLLAELARYRPGRIVCDPRVADLRLSGLFHVKETDRALQFLVQTQPISVTYHTRFWVTVGPREAH
ncbi:FecR domain-containing protein [Candidatus Nitrotoga arctica]|uniref:FecR family protein n=1 Tax=Candidatus Nitrotoga arctica TaxID=453162 RepID=A0ABM8Z248_9PROT|nr:FecR domain-containing protein [Candidatus Nitrotoga arctica]CAG9933956.1 FecR family protein [Candidatus Nitrotoga arctica]